MKRESERRQESANYANYAKAWFDPFAPEAAVGGVARARCRWQTRGGLRMSSQNQFLLYTAPNGAVKVDVFFKGETVWLTQKALAELFGVKRPAITKHLLNIFSTGELAEDSVCSILEHTAGDGKTYSAKYYNLDAIIAVGYRVILQDRGKVSALEAKLKAEGEYEVYRQRQDAEYVSDFDREIKRIEGKKP
jgi:hypothetical protein